MLILPQLHYTLHQSSKSSLNYPSIYLPSIYPHNHPDQPPHSQFFHPHPISQRHTTTLHFFSSPEAPHNHSDQSPHSQFFHPHPNPQRHTTTLHFFSFPEAPLPSFGSSDPEKIVAAVGREAVFRCTVKNIREHQVRKTDR